MKKQTILISLFAVMALTACGAEPSKSSEKSGGGNSQSPSSSVVINIEDYGITKFEAEDFDDAHWEIDESYDGEVFVENSKASGGMYLAAADKALESYIEFSFKLEKYSKVVFSAAYAQMESDIRKPLEMDKTYFYAIEGVNPFELVDGKTTLAARSSATSWELMEYKPQTLWPGEYKVTLSVMDNCPNNCPSIDYVQFKTSDPTITPVNPSDIDEVPDNDFHNLQQYRYLMDDNWRNFATYANGSDLSAPSSIKLRFNELDNANTYYVQVSESSSFAGAPIKTTTVKYYELWNAKLATTYYYRAATSEAGLDSAEVKSLTSTSLAPRVLNVPNVLNFRDIGGWSTSLVEGGKINQGLYFRCAQLNQAGSSSTRSELDSAGKGLAALKELGIKVDIDMRDSYNVPSQSPANTADWPVKLVKASVASSTESGRWEGDHNLDHNIGATYKTIFETIANCDNEPALLHCTYGADRTGIVSFFLEAILGMSYEDMARDYVWTKFTQGRDPNPDGEFSKWVSKTEACEGDTFAEKMKNHLMASPINISASTIEHIREIFIDGYVAQA